MLHFILHLSWKGHLPLIKRHKAKRERETNGIFFKKIIMMWSIAWYRPVYRAITATFEMCIPVADEYVVEVAKFKGEEFSFNVFF